MGELQAGIAYWLSVGVRAVKAFPEFIGNNWMGILLSLALLLPSAWRSLRNHFREIRRLAWSERFFFTGRALMSTNWRTVSTVVGMFLCINFLKIAFQDYSAVAGQRDALTSQATEARKGTDKAVQDLKDQMGNLKVQCASVEGSSKRLEQQNRDYQSTISNCLVQLGKNQEAVRTTVFNVGVLATGTQPIGSGHVVGLLVITNKPISPIRLLVNCDYKISTVSGGVMVSLNRTLAFDFAGDPSKPISEHQYRIRWVSPTWGPDNPILLQILPAESITADGPHTCNVSQE